MSKCVGDCAIHGAAAQPGLLGGKRGVSEVVRREGMHDTRSSSMRDETCTVAAAAAAAAVAVARSFPIMHCRRSLPLDP